MCGSLVRRVQVDVPSRAGAANDYSSHKTFPQPDWLTDPTERAVLVQTVEGYEKLRAGLPHNTALLGPDRPGCGENLFVDGLVQWELCVGDVFAVAGSGLQLEVTSPRRPCENWNHVHGLEPYGDGSFYRSADGEGNCRCASMITKFTTAPTTASSSVATQVCRVAASPPGPLPYQALRPAEHAGWVLLASAPRRGAWRRRHADAGQACMHSRRAHDTPAHHVESRTKRFIGRSTSMLILIAHLNGLGHTAQPAAPGVAAKAGGRPLLRQRRRGAAGLVGVGWHCGGAGRASHPASVGHRRVEARPGGAP
jgi:hypothetical protein